MADEDSLADDWQLVSPYLEEVLSLEPAQRPAWLRALAARAPLLSDLVRGQLERLEELDRLRFMEPPK